MSTEKQEAVEISEIKKRHEAAKAQVEEMEKSINEMIKARDEYVKEANAEVDKMNQELAQTIKFAEAVAASRDTLASLMPPAEEEAEEEPEASTEE